VLGADEQEPSRAAGRRARINPELLAQIEENAPDGATAPAGHARTRSGSGRSQTRSAQAARGSRALLRNEFVSGYPAVPDFVPVEIIDEVYFSRSSA
jgi:hypothetical protein